MSIKTAYDYNEDDFIERNGSLEEITVTITLSEYRCLLTDRCFCEKTIEQLQDENKALKEQNENLCKLIAGKNPDMIKCFGEFVKDFFEN